MQLQKQLNVSREGSNETTDSALLLSQQDMPIHISEYPTNRRWCDKQDSHNENTDAVLQAHPSPSSIQYIDTGKSRELSKPR